MRKTIKSIFLLLMLVTIGTNLVAQGKRESRVISGKVIDAVTKDPLIGCIITLKDEPGIGTTADIDGNFKIEATDFNVLQVNYLGYEGQEFIVAKIDKALTVELSESTTQLDEVVVTAAGSQRKVSLTGAITTVDTKTLRAPTANLSNALAGNVAGIIARQTSGEPGENFSEFWVRGLSTFGANSSALVLVDGVERSLDQVKTEDIESFSVLKDASATAIYGQRGANGVVLITTKRGEAGKINIHAKVQYGYDTRSRTPDYADGVAYAKLMNEAYLSRYQEARYSGQNLVAIENRLDPDMFPNVNWRDVLLKDGASNYEAYMSFRGGGTNARYFVSGAYVKQNGMYITRNDLNTYNTNSTYERYNYRANVDMDITSTTLLSMNVSGYLVNRTQPGVETNEIWESMNRMTPLTIPRMYSNGWTPSLSDSGADMNPEVLMTRSGYNTKWENKAEISVSLAQNLDFITQGLKVYGVFAFDTNNHNNVDRKKRPELYYVETRDPSNNNALLMKTRFEEQTMTQSLNINGSRRYYLEANVNYEKLIAEAHRVTAFAMIYRQETLNTNDFKADDLITTIPYRNLAYSGRFTYGFRDRYLAEFNWGYTGSENFQTGKKFGFFPAFSAGWVISEEPIIKDAAPWLNLFKVRASYGENGNDRIGGKRFPYVSLIQGDGDYNWGEYGAFNRVSGYRMGQVGSENLTWEVAKKYDLGFDFSFLNQKLTGTIDFFRETRDDIFMERSNMPFSTGLQDIKPWANVGRFEKYGYDGNLSFSDKIGKVEYTLRGNFTYARNEILDYDEPANILPYKMKRGYRNDQNRGLIALGLFKDQADIDNSPFQDLGETVLPGDIKYKDVNGDGKINDDDVVPLGYTNIPEVIYGVGLSLYWNNWEFNTLLQGSGNYDFFVGGYGVHPFREGTKGNILKVMADSDNRWIPKEISGNAATENPNAEWPRLTYQNNKNNNRNSTFWLKNGRYLRLKNLELAYNLPNKFTKKFNMSNVRLGFIGYNMFVWSPFKWWDPENNTNGAESQNGANYPITKTYSFSLRVDF